MDQATVHHASCGCGALSVVAHGEPARVLLCSCTTCQKRTGSALGITALWPQDSVVVTGPSTKWVRPGQGGRDRPAFLRDLRHNPVVARRFRPRHDLRRGGLL